MGKHSNRPRKSMPSKGMAIPKLKKYANKSKMKKVARGKSIRQNWSR